jgi:hypothetical protein
VSRPFLIAGFAALLAVGLVAGCVRDPGPLDVGALRPAERRYVERYVTLERARAVALADPARGVAILDSLAAAWGDTAERMAAVDLPADPRRAARVQELVGRLLAAETDSLLHAPLPRRLRAPLPQPVAAEGS